MNADPLKKRALIHPPTNPGTPTLFAVRERALELALLHGRSVSDVSEFDREQALLDLTSPTAPTPKAAL